MAFHEKVVLITGASSGIGRALAEEFARQGAQVVPVARSGENSVDVTKLDQVQRIVANTLARFGRIDVLVNCAGIGMVAAAVEMETSDLRAVLETNFFGAYNALRAVSRHMIERRSGLIIQMSSVNGFCAVPLGSAYVASKFALEGFSRCARAELRPHNIRVLIVRPGLTDTGFFDKAKNFRANDPFPMKRMLSPEYVAKKTVEAAARGRKEIVLSWEGKFIWCVNKLSPQLADWIIATATNRYRASRRAQTKAPSTDRTAAPSPQNPPAPDRAPRPAAK